MAFGVTAAWNGSTEAVNFTIKVMERCGVGFQILINHRLRSLLVTRIT